MAEIGRDLTRAISLLKQGELVAIPTETVYGLAGNALDSGAVAKIFDVKDRPYFDPLIMHVSEWDAVSQYATDIPEAARQLGERFWPGPLTLVLPKKGHVPDLTSAGLDTIGIRCPDHPLTHKLLEELPFPLAAPSANPFGYVSPTTARHVDRQLGERIHYILDGGTCDVGIESTIVGFEAGEPVIYRFGGLPMEAIESVVGPLAARDHSTSNPRSPGQLKSHYAPRKRVIIGELAELIKERSFPGAGVISFQTDFGIPHQIVLSREGSLQDAARNLFAALRQADEFPVDEVLVEYVPDIGIGRAINDRLRRAASHFALIVLVLAVSVCGQAQDLLKRQLAESGQLGRLMREDPADGGMSRWLKKPVQGSRDLPLATDFSSLRLAGPGTLAIDSKHTHSGKGSVVIETPTSLGVKNPSNRSYASAELIRPLKGEDLRGYNRFSVWVYADAPGFYSVFVGCTLYNQGTHVMPVPGRFEGQHFVTVYPNRWQRILWELPDLYRDSVTGFSVNIMLTGSPKGASRQMKLYVDDMTIESVEAENTRGFDLRKNAIAYSHSGYRADAVKQALVQHTDVAAFEVVSSNGKAVFKGTGKILDKGFVQLDFSPVKTPGYYKLRVGGRITGAFPIGNDAFLATAWRTLNFFYAERCGYDQPGIHQECHKDVSLVHPDGRRVSISGGWHDAADLTQGLGNTARGGMAMLELATAVDKSNPALRDRLVAEARWGLNWVLETRFGDGYRSGGLIIGIWSDNIVGTKDDMEGKANNRPSDNFMSAAYCAMGAPHFEKTDPVFYSWCRNAAVEDYGFAKEMLGTAVTKRNEAELYGLATMSAMRLYRLTGAKQYLDDAAAYARVVMDCQQRDKRSDWSIPLRGFFYESRSHERIMEYFHQSHEHVLLQGLTMLLKSAPDHADAPEWKAACTAYGEYLLAVRDVIAPYHIVPAAVYEINNAEFAGIYHEGDRVGMPSMEEYNAQVKNGIRLSEKFYLRRFPVAYQFRGFHAIHLSKAKAALVLAETLNNMELRNLGTRQLEYIVGFNPFAMSTIYGDGYDYPPLYGAYAGDVVGAVPVGIETFENDDEPYMPMQVNATYKEIWTHTTAAVMSVIASVMSN